MSDISNLRDTIIPKSDQLNAEQLLSGPMTITVTSVRRGSDDQPIIIGYANDGGRPFKPCKSMRKVLIYAWGDDGNNWIGKSMTLFNNPSVKWGGVAVGGIRISHLSDIERELSLSLSVTKGKREPFIIGKLVPPADAKVERFRDALNAKAASGLAAVRDALSKTPDAIKSALGPGWISALESRAREHDVAVNVGDALEAEAADYPPAKPEPVKPAEQDESDPF